MKKKETRIAIIDLYNNEENEGIRCLREIAGDLNLNQFQIPVSHRVYETRYKDEVPEIDYDIFISSGGPGSPFEGINQKWESDYFSLIEKIWDHNQTNPERKKYIFFICHSFQMMARYFKFAEVNERYEKSFGVFPFRRTSKGKSDLIFENLPDPFYAADFRKYQVVQKNHKIMDDLEANILALEIDDGIHESALMAVRISDEIVGTQFHPEADPNSMMFHLIQEERKKFIIDKFGEAKYREMVSNLEDPDKIKLTRSTVLPAFLISALEKLNFIKI